MLWIAAGLTLVTGYDYLMIGLKHMAAEPPSDPRGGRSGDPV
jgi:hypothetical protein